MGWHRMVNGNKNKLLILIVGIVMEMSCTLNAVFTLFSN